MGQPTNDDSYSFYEMFVCSEWSQEPEPWRVPEQVTTSKSSPSLSPKKLMSFFSQSTWPPEEFMNYLAPLLPWHLAISPNGKLVAILQELLLEIRTCKDEYTSIVGRASVCKESCPQLRKLLWSPDSQMIVVCYSEGLVNIYDTFGVLVYTIPVPQNLTDGPGSVSVAGLEFLRSLSQNKSLNDVLVVYSTGHLCAYDFTLDKMCVEVYRAHLERLKPGITGSAFLEKYNLLILASLPQASSKTFKESSLMAGISAWRFLNEYPYFQMIFPIEDEFSLISSNLKVWKFFRSACLGVAVKMRISHSQQYLASLHTCGTIVILLLPSLKFHRKWPLERRDDELRASTNLLPVDIEWRSDDSLIVTRKDGSVCVHDISTFDIDPGFGCEYLNGYPRLSSSSHVLGFLSLECELSMLASPRDDGSSLVSDEKSFLNSSFDVIQSTLYVITDMENFKPKKRSPKVMQRIYRLFAFKSVTPEGLFYRMLDNDDYDGALELADKFGIDSDLVYKKQWAKTSVSPESIIRVLSKVRNVEWVLIECVTRFPDTIEGASSLIDFGFHITAFDKVFTGKTPEYLDELLNTDKLTDLQRQMIKTRLVLIEFRDKLRMFNEIFYPACEDDLHGYSLLRSCHVVVYAIELAKNGNWHGVEIIFNHCSDQLTPYWLSILNHLPETMPPSSYHSLLPKCNSEGNLVRWFSTPYREKDWVEHHVFKTLKPQLDDDDMEKYQPITDYSMNVLTEWYSNRSLELARRSQIVSNAVELIELGKKNNIQGLNKLYFDLLTLECFVYEIDHDMDLTSLSKMTEYEKALKMLSNSDEYSFIHNVENFLLPFVERSSEEGYSNKQDLLLNTFSTISSNNLDWLINLLHVSLDGSLDIGELPFIARVIVECVYAYDDVDLLDECLKLVLRALVLLKEELVHDEHEEMTVNSLKTLRDEIRISKLLFNHDLNYSVNFIHSMKQNTEDALNIMKDFARCIGEFSNFNDVACRDYLDNLLMLEKLFKECVPPNCAYEMFTWAVLNAGNVKLFDSLKWVLCRKKELESKSKLSFEKSSELVLEAARNYFNKARDHKDKSLNLAKACLYLIDNDSDDLQEEIDLITAIQILHEVGVNQIPLQVREMEDRMKLVNHCLRKSRTLFKKPELVYRLAACLRVFGSDSHKRRRKLSIRLAEEAYQHKEFNLCASYCEEIISLNCSEGWEICRAVADCDEYSNLEKKCELVNFALTCAPDKELPFLLKIRRSLMEKASEECLEEYHSDLSSSIQKACFGCPAFYASLHEKAYITDLFPTYDTIDCNSAKVPYFHRSVTDLLECCLKYVCEDTLLGFNYMLSYENPEACEDVFKALPPKLFTFELAVLYYSFRSLPRDQLPIFLTKSTTELLNYIEAFPGEVKYREKIDAYKKKCSDYLIVQRLSHMEHTGIDYERYIGDSDYRRDTILGLSLFPEHVDEALFLAGENEISLAEVTVTSIKSSLLNSDTGALKETLENENVVKGLQSNPKLVFDTLLSVFDHIDGRNHPLMITFFTMLKVTDDGKLVFDLPPSQHIKVLKRLKSVDLDIKYQDLISANGNLCEVLKDCVTPDSINSIVKFIKTLPNAIKKDFEIGSLFLEFMVKQYKLKCLSVSNSVKKCVTNFQSCLVYLDKLNVKSRVEFLSRTILSMETLQNMEASRRKLLLASFFEFYRKQIKQSGDADEVEIVVEDNLDKLNLIYNDEDEDIILSCPKIESYLLKIEMNYGQTEALKEVLEACILDSTLSHKGVLVIHKASRLEAPLLEIIKSTTVSPEKKMIIDKRKNEIYGEIPMGPSGKPSTSPTNGMPFRDSQEPCDMESDDILTAFKSADSLTGFEIAVELAERLSDNERQHVCCEVLKMYGASDFSYNKYEATESIIEYVDFSSEVLVTFLLELFEIPSSDKKFILWLLLRTNIPSLVNEAMSRFNDLELAVIKEYFTSENSVPSAAIAQALINSSKYCDFIRLLREEEDFSTLRRVADALKAAGAVSESGTLRMACVDVPMVLRSFYQSLR